MKQPVICKTYLKDVKDMSKCWTDKNTSMSLYLGQNQIEFSGEVVKVATQRYQ